MQNQEQGFFIKNLNVIMFIALSVSWGFSWFCGLYQIPSQSNPIGIFPEVSAFYRFIIAAIILICIYYPIKRPKILLSIEEFKIVMVYGLFSFCLNFIIFYYAIYYMVTGINAVIFSLSIIFNYIIGKFVFKINKELNWKFYLSSFIGILGLIFVVRDKFHLPFGGEAIIGIIICFFGTASYSFGAVFYESKSKIIKSDSLVVFIWCLIFGSAYGLLIGFFHSVFTGVEFKIIPHFSFKFLLSLLYLAGPATAIGYLCNMLLIKRIGAVKVGYTTLISPSIAILVTAIFENYTFTLASLIGLVLIICSKIIMFYKK